MSAGDNLEAALARWDGERERTANTSNGDIAPDNPDDEPTRATSQSSAALPDEGPGQSATNP